MTELPLSMHQLSVPERIALAQALWDSIGTPPDRPISDARRAELDRRAAEDDAQPETVVPWEQVQATILARLGQQ